jgi:hypothetical protein
LDCAASCSESRCGRLPRRERQARRPRRAPR